MTKKKGQEEGNNAFIGNDMRAELENLKIDIEKSISLLKQRANPSEAQRRLDELEALSQEADFWDNPQKAQSLMREKNTLTKSLGEIEEIERALYDNIELSELAELEGDEAIIDEAKAALEDTRERARRAELEALLSGEADANDCYMEINAGAGGTESQDWAAMLRRMYMRWANSRGFVIEQIDENIGEEAGIKSATILIKGEFAYGWAKTESGVHRLVRISPFDSNAKRHTSFASVWVYPVIDDEIEIEIDEKDVRIDTYRAQGAGGQHINTTDSAVRITHIPTNIAVASQQERSQHKNRDIAWKMLRARLYELELQKREEAAQSLQDSKTDIGWGHQIRSYVLQPYQMVKDLRTNLETSDTGGVLDGDLDKFMAASLAAKVATHQ